MCQTLSFSGYQGCEGRKSCKISDLIIFRILRLGGLQIFQGLETFRLYYFEDTRVATVGKAGKFKTL